MNLRKEIRKILEEAMETNHFRERMFDRLNSEYTTFRLEKPELKNRVKEAIDFVKQVNFPGQDNIGILLMKSPNKYIYHREVMGKTEHSEGSFVWAVVRANDMETIVFGDSAYKPRNTQIHLTIDRLKNYILQDKDGDFNLTEKDLRKLVSPAPKPVGSSVASEPGLPIININGTRYVVDVKGGIVYKKNSPNATMDLYKFIDTVDPETQEMILSLV